MKELIYWSYRKILKTRYHYHGELIVYYNNKRIKDFPYCTQKDHEKASKWLENFEENINNQRSLF